MSDAKEESRGETVAADAGTDSTARVSPALPPPRQPASYLGAAIALTMALVLVVALAGTAPFWAPALQWAPAPSAPPLDPRIVQIEAATQTAQQDVAAVKTALQRLDQRLGALEARPAPAVGDIAELRTQVANLSAAAGNLAARVETLDRSVQAQGSADSDLAHRLEALDKTVRSQAVSDPTDTALVLVLLQIHDAIAAGRPFAAEYEALTALARARPEIAAAAAPLAEPAKAGVAGRAVLTDRLRELAPAITRAGEVAAPAAADGGGGDWTGQVLSRLGGLVQVRRIDGSKPPPESDRQALVDNAMRELAGGDLAAAVAVLDRPGAGGEAAGPWLRMARQRLAVEAALRQIEALLATRLGNAAAAPGAGR
jgi:hypothetical protein